MGVDKNTLLKMLDEAMALEERAIPLYSRHLKTAMFWSGLDPVEREHLRIQLGVLEQESNRHHKVLTAMKEKIKEDERDVF